MDKIKVIIADDSDFVRDGMKIILDVDDDFDVKLLRLRKRLSRMYSLWIFRCRKWME